VSVCDQETDRSDWRKTARPSDYSSTPRTGGIVIDGGRTSRPEGPNIEAQRAESGVEFLGEGQLAPSPPARRSGERCKLPSGVWGGAPAEIEFGTFLPKNVASGETAVTTNGSH